MICLGLQPVLFLLHFKTILIFVLSLASRSVAQLNSRLDVPQNADYVPLDVSTCSVILPPKYSSAIKGYQSVADSIFHEITEGRFRNKMYKNVAKFVDRFGPRISGSEVLEKSIDYMKDKFTRAGFQDVVEQPVKVPRWVRGAEYAEILKPHPKAMRVLGLGTSIGTGTEGIVGEVVVVKDMDELREIGEKGGVESKIVVFNFKVTWYKIASGIVSNAASNASLYGAKAVMTKSITKVSINSPHAKYQHYKEGVRKIPVASITLEDAELLGRLYDRGEQIQVKLVMNIIENTESLSRNLIGDYKGLSRPSSIVLVSGHIDSWDVGQGVQDDAVGVFLAYEAIRLFQKLNLKPARTIRAVAWTAEEMSSEPAREYIRKYSEELESHNVLMEADFGCYKPTGFYYSKSPEVGCILNEITRLFPQTNTTNFTPVKEIPNDLDEFLAHVDVPTVSFNGNDGRYFWYHHTEGDTMSATDPDELDLCLGVWATTAFVLADMPFDVPR